MISWNLTHPLQLSNFSCNLHVPRVPGIQTSILLTVRTPEMASFGFSRAWLGVAKAKQICLSTNTRPTSSCQVSKVLQICQEHQGQPWQPWDTWHLKWKVSPSVSKSFPCQPHESKTFVVGVGAHLSMGYLRSLRGSTGDQQQEQQDEPARFPHMAKPGGPFSMRTAICLA